MLFTRRKFLEGSLKSASALAAGGVLPAALWRESFARGAASTEETIVPFILTVFASGGWDPTMIFDPKIGSQYASQESGAALARGAGKIPFVDHGSRPSVKSFFTQYGANAAIVNGLCVGSMTRRGSILNAFGTVPPNKIRPVDWFTYYAASLDPFLDAPHLIIDAPYMPGDYTVAAVRITTPMLKHYGEAIPNAIGLGNKAEKALAKYRQDVYAQLFDLAGNSLDGEKLRALYYGEAREAKISARITAAQTALGPQGVDSDFLRNGKLAVEMFASGATLAATVQAGGDGAWETRSNHYSQATILYENLFSDLNSIMDHAAKAGVANKMIVIVISDGGRAPMLNADQGKGPWPVTSALFWGPGIAGGTVAGLTDAALRSLPVNPIFGDQSGSGTVNIEMANVAAAIYTKTNVPTKLILPDVKPLSILLSETKNK